MGAAGKYVDNQFVSSHGLQFLITLQQWNLNFLYQSQQIIWNYLFLMWNEAGKGVITYKYSLCTSYSFNSTRFVMDAV